MSTKTYEGKRELRWRQVAGCLITYIEEQAIQDELWDAWLAAVGDPRTQVVMLCAWGPSKPTTAQWRSFTNTIKSTGVPVAVVTEDRHNAALAKKAAWVGAKIESFKWGDNLYEPMVFLGFELDTRKQMKPHVFELRDCFGPVDGKASSAAATSRAMPAWMKDDAQGGWTDTTTLSSLERPRSGTAATPASPQPGPSGTSSATEARAKAKAKARGLSAEFRRSRDAVFQSSSDIQAKLAEVQARLRARNLDNRRH